MTKAPYRRAPGGGGWVPSQHSDGGLMVKIALRSAALPSGDEPVILDAFAGEGDIWRGVREATGRNLRVVGVDSAAPARLGLRKGDNVGALESVDLDKVAAVDLDAWGMPAAQLGVLARRDFPGPIYFTWLMSGFARPPLAALDVLGIPRSWVRMAPMEVRRRDVAWLSDVLGLLGWREMTMVDRTKAGTGGVYGVLNTTVDPEVYSGLLQRAAQPVEDQ